MTSASRRLKRAGLWTVGWYFLVFLSTFYANARLHPQGVMLWVLAVLPVLPMLFAIVLFGRYLRDESDEYKRELTMRFLLWGTAGCLAVNMLAGFLAIYGWKGALPPFSGFWAFFVFMLAAKMKYKASNPVPADE